MLDFPAVTHRLTSEQSEGSIYVFESAFEPGAGNRLHVHETRSCYLFLAVPGGLDRWFDAVAEANGAGALDHALVRKLSEDYGIGWLE